MNRDNSTTEQFLAEAGITAGMRVLEIGCGGGEVSELLAKLVGPSGAVVAVDNNENALNVARDRLCAAGVGHAQFIAADIAVDLTALEPYAKASFDVLAGRRVLMYLQQPAEVIHTLSAWLRSGGLIVFEEADSTTTPGRTSPLAAHDQAAQWLKQMLVAEGADPSMGLNLPATLKRAGATFEKIRGVAVIEGQGAQYPLSVLLTLMKARLLAAGIATEKDLDSLLPQLNEEATDTTRAFVSGMSYCAWARKP